MNKYGKIYHSPRLHYTYVISEKQKYIYSKSFISNPKRQQNNIQRHNIPVKFHIPRL